MEERRIAHVTKDSNGEVLTISNYMESWKTRTKAQAIEEIERKVCSYYVLGEYYQKIYVAVCGLYPKYLRTKKNGNETDNLSKLPAF